MAYINHNKSREDRNKASRKKSDKSPIVGEIDTTLNAFSLNVEQAQADAKKVYSALLNQHQDYLGTTTRAAMSSYTQMYNGLRDLHKKYLKDILHAERMNYKNISEIYGQPITIKSETPEANEGSPSNKNKNKNKNNENSEDTARAKALEEQQEANRIARKKTDTVIKVVNSVLSVLSLFTKEIRSGFENYLDTYVKNFNTYTTSFNTNSSGISNIISRSISTLDSSIGTGFYNITADLLPALEKVAKTGLQGDKAISKATDDVIASKIMPYLDTSSAVWTNFYANATESTIKTLKGQQLQLKQTQTGSRLLESGVINSLTEEMEPLLRDIEYNTGSIENLGVYQDRMAELVDAGFTEKEAYQFIKENYVDTSKNLYGALTSGSVTKMLIAQDMAQGGSGREGEQRSANIFKGSSSNLESSAIASVMGMVGDTYTKSNTDAYLNSFTDEMKVSTGTAESFYEDAKSGISDVTHATTVVTNTMENMGAKAATLVQNMDQHIVDGLLNIYDTAKQILFTIIANAVTDKLFKSFGGADDLADGAGKLAKSADKMDDAAGALKSAAPVSGTAAKGALSTAGAYVAGAAPGAIAVVGGAGAVNMGVNSYQKIDENNTSAVNAGYGTAGTLQVAGGIGLGAAGVSAAAAGVSAAAGGAGAAAAAGAGVAALASNPVGWVALAAIAVGTTIGLVVDANKKVNGFAEALEASKEMYISSVHDTISAQQDQLLSIEKSIEATGSDTEARNQLVSLGISKETLATIKTTEELKNFTQGLVDSLSDVQKVAQDKVSKEVDDAVADLRNDLTDNKRNSFIQSATQQVLGGKDTKKGSAEHVRAKNFLYDLAEGMTGGDKETFLKAVDTSLDSNGGLSTAEFEALLGSKSAAANWRAFWSTDLDLENSYLDNASDLTLYNDVIKKYGLNEGAMVDDSKVKALQSSGTTRGILDGLYAEWSSETDSTQKSAIRDMYVAELNKFKNADYYSNFASTYEGYAKKMGVPGYKEGLDYVPYNDYPALLHEGEAVLTKGDSNIVRNLGSAITSATEPVANLMAMVRSSSSVKSGESASVPVDNTETILSKVQGMITSLIEAIYGASDRIIESESSSSTNQSGNQMTTSYDSQRVSMVKSFM